MAKRRLTRRRFLYGASGLAVAGAVGGYSVMSLPPFGAMPSGSRLKRILASPNYRDGDFQNPEPTQQILPGKMSSTLWEFAFNKPKDTEPSKPVPAVETNLKGAAPAYPELVWFGHSSYLLRLSGLTILVDPVLSGYASPFSFFGKCFPAMFSYKVEHMPERIDVLLLTHDHYDHLDYTSVKQLAGRTTRIVASLGVGAHLERWGVPDEKITELDWWETTEVAPGITFTATPARHFSGRGLKRFQSLWSGFALKTPDMSLFLGGDSGYGSHFKEIGRRLGPFDWALLECGQYGKNWPQIHMMPEEVAQAANDIGAKRLLPVHWGRFALAMHPWKEPVERLLAAVEKTSLPVSTPRIGEPFRLDKPGETGKWWVEV